MNPGRPARREPHRISRRHGPARGLNRSATGGWTMLRAMLAVATVAFATPAIAEECQPAAPVFGALQQLRATRMTYDGDAVQRAVRLFAGMPPAGDAPEADHLVVAELPSGSVVLLLLKGTGVCATLMIPDPRMAQLAKEAILGIQA